MGSKTDYLENKVLVDNIGTPAVFVGLFTVSPGEAGGGTEVDPSTTSYDRVAIDFTIVGNTATQNGVSAFAQAAENWGTQVAWGVFDAAVAGNLLYWGDINPTKAVNTGDTPSFADGEIVITED